MSARVKAGKVASISDQSEIAWPGGECPVDPETRVYVRYRDGISSKIRTADGLRWEHEGLNDDIVAYRAVPADAARDERELA